MNRLHLFPVILVAFCLAILMAGCSGASSPLLPSQDQTQNVGTNPVTPVTPNAVNPAGPVDPALTGTTEREEDTATYPREDRMFYGIWDIAINPDTLEAEIIPNRALMMHVNVTQMVTPPQCNNCLGIQVLNVDPVAHIVSVKVSLKNPTLAITGYDVRGTLLFPTGDNRKLVNAEGYTKIFAGDVRSPFRAFAKTEPSRQFLPQAIHYEQYDILFPPPMNLYVTYAVDASWPGNQEEPYLIDDEHLDGGMNECNSAEGFIYADMYDWQGNVENVQIDFTPLGGEVVDMQHIINKTYRAYINNEWGAGPGTYDIWITATSQASEYALYDIYPLVVDPCTNWPPIWDDTVGITELVSVSGGLDVHYGNATDSDEPVAYNIYVSETLPIEWTTATYETDTDGSPYILGGLSDDTTYFVGVRAVDALGAEEKNTVQLSGIPSNPPVWTTTVGIVIANPLDKAVECVYGVATDPQGPVTYNVYWSETTPIDFGTASFVNDAGSPTTIDTLDNFKTYHFAVRAIDALGSEDENTVELPAIPNGAPEWLDTVGIISTIPGHQKVTVTYGEATDVDLPIVYNIYVSDTTPIDFGSITPLVDPDGSPFTVNGLTNGQTYNFAVRAEDSVGVEEHNTVELPGIPNSMPTWLNGEVGVQSLIPFDHEVTVNYGEATDPDLPVTYYIYYSTTTPINFTTAPYETTTSQSPYVLDGLTNFVPIYIAVRAEDALGIMEDNTVQVSTIPNPAPVWDTTTGITTLEPGNQQATAIYGTATDIDAPVVYRVYYSLTTPINFTTALFIVDDASPTLIPNLANGVPVYAAVRAVDSFGHEEQNTVTKSAIPMAFPEETWSVFTGGVVQSSPVFVDLNGDLIDDVVIGDQGNKMVAYSGVNGSVIWTFPTTGWVDSSAAIADMGGSDSTPDVIFGCLDKKVYCVDGATGAEIWQATTSGGIISSPCLANIKNDFHLDVIIGSMDGSVYAYDGTNGAALWSFPTGAGVFSSPATADLTGDSIPDFVVGSRDGNVYAINGNSGLQIWDFPIGDWVNSSPALANLNAGGVPDAVIAGLDGMVYAIDGSTGGEIWHFDTGSYVWTSPAIGFMNGDATPDVVLGADSSNVYAINGLNGSAIWTFPSNDRIWSSAALVDINTDDVPDAIVGSDDGYLYAIDGASGLALFYYDTADWIDSSPAAGDIDNDGHIDIAFGRYDGYVTLVSVDYSIAGEMPWPMFRRDLAHTAAF